MVNLQGLSLRILILIIANAKIPFQKNRHIFSYEQEKELKQYILFCSNIYFGLSPMDIQILAFELAISNNLKIPMSWEANTLAVTDWFSSFMKRHYSLCIRNEAISLARATSFNHQNVKVFLKTLNRLLHMDETAVSTMQKLNKDVSRKRFKQVGATISADKGTLSTLADVSGGDNSVQPFFVL